MCIFHGIYTVPPKASLQSWTRKLNCPIMTSSNGNIFRVTGPLCREFTGPGEFPAQRPVTRSFDVFFHLRLNKRLSKQPRGWWFETPPWSLWRQCNARWQYLWHSSQCVLVQVILPISCRVISSAYDYQGNHKFGSNPRGYGCMDHVINSNNN